ncbi:MAG: hypothetical protein OIF51_13520, partial [Cellvibrionaceae bacterium]|nr:hypothetical protein [Cellvibrionaceae bacterium]
MAKGGGQSHANIDAKAKRSQRIKEAEERRKGILAESRAYEQKLHNQRREERQEDAATARDLKRESALQTREYAMRLDAKTFGKQVEEVMDGELRLLGKLKEADAYYKKNFVPFKENKVLNTALKNNEPEATLKALNSQNGSEFRTSTFYHSLNPEGKKRVQLAFLLDAYERSFRDDTFSPRAFRTNIGKLDRVHGILFSGEDKKLPQNLVDVLEYTKRSAESKGNPMN